jgi:hypothetical protein
MTKPSAQAQGPDRESGDGVATLAELADTAI